MPHARHGCKGKDACAVPGSKPAGIGLEKEQIRQIQFAIDCGRGVESLEGRKGLLALETVDEDDPSAAIVLSPCLTESGPYFSSFGWKMILGEDFRKPA